MQCHDGCRFLCWCVDFQRNITSMVWELHDTGEGVCASANGSIKLQCFLNILDYAKCLFSKICFCIEFIEIPAMKLKINLKSLWNLVIVIEFCSINSLFCSCYIRQYRMIFYLLEPKFFATNKNDSPVIASREIFNYCQIQFTNSKYSKIRNSVCIDYISANAIEIQSSFQRIHKNRI